MVTVPDPSTRQLPEPRPIPLTGGGRVSSGNIVGRDEVIRRWWSALEASSLVIAEPRRIGKTSALRLMAEHPPAGWECIHLSVQGVATTASLIAETVDRLRRHSGSSHRVREVIGAVLKNASAEVGFGGAKVTLSTAFAESPTDTLGDVLTSVADQLVDDDKRLVIVWDEFPDAIGAIADAEGESAAVAVLGTMRSLREGPAGERIRWILTGSVGLHHVLRRLSKGSDKVNDLSPARLGPLTPTWSSWLVRSYFLGVGREIGEADARAIAEAADGIPFVIGLIVGAIHEGARVIPGTADDARKILLEAAADLDGSANLAPMLTRLTDYYGADQHLAESVLDLLARRPMTRGELRDSITAVGPNAVEHSLVNRLDDVLILLRQDHYVTWVPNQPYQWRYAAFRDIWIGRRGGR